MCKDQGAVMLMWQSLDAEVERKEHKMISKRCWELWLELILYKGYCRLLLLLLCRLLMESVRVDVLALPVT